MSSNSVLQYNTPSLAITLISLAIHLHFSCNTRPTCKPHCNTIPCIAIQFSSLTKVAIQCLGLQYNCLAIQLPCNTMPWLAILLQYNFFLFFQPSLLQYKCKIAIQKKKNYFFSQYNWAIAQFRFALLLLFFFHFFFISSKFPTNGRH